MSERPTPVIWCRSLDAPEATELLVRSILSLEYTEEEKSASRMRLTFESRDGELLASPAIARGAVLEVAFGYESQRTRPLRCVVRRVSGNLREIVVEANSAGVLMDTAQRGRTFRGARRSDVVREIARENGFPASAIDVEDTEDVFESISQAGKTDAAFLQELARREGKQFWVDESGLHFRERDLAQEPALVLTYGGKDSVFNADPTFELDGAGRSGRVSSSSRDPVAKKTTTVVSDNDRDAGRFGLGEIIEVVDPETRESEFRIGSERVPAAVALAADRLLIGAEAVEGALRGLSPLLGGGRGGTGGRVSQDVTEQVATSKEGATRAASRGKYRESSRTAIKLSIDVIGEPRLMARRVVVLEGLPAGLSGPWWVASVTHRIGEGYDTTADLKKDGRSQRPSACADGTPRQDVEAALRDLVAAAARTFAGGQAVVATAVLSAYATKGAAAEKVVRDAALSMTGKNMPAEVREAALRVVGLIDNAGPCDPAKSKAVIKTGPGGVGVQLVEEVDPDSRETAFAFRLRE